MKSTLPPKPRTRQAPSERDLQIYLAWQTGRTQVELAKQYGISQSRISQLICRVRASRTPHQAPTHHAPAAPTLDLGPETLDLAVHRQQLEFITRESLRAWRQENKTVTQKTGARGDMPIDETTTKTAPPNLQCLRVALQAVRAVGNVLRDAPPAQARSASEAPTTEAAVSADMSFAARQQQFVDLLTDLLNECVADDKVRSTGVCDDERDFATDLAAFLFGQPHRGFGVAVVAADAQHGRLRRGPQFYPGRDALRIDGGEVPGLNSEREQSGPDQAQDTACTSATLNLEPETSNPSTTATPLAADSPQTPAAPPLPIQNPKSNIQNDPDLARYISAGLSEVSARRLRHQEKLDELRRLQRTGLPYLMYFDSIDGRPPPL